MPFDSRATHAPARSDNQVNTRRTGHRALRVVYVFPGYRHDITSKPYRALKHLFTRKGYRAVFVRFTWRNGTLTDYLHQFFSQYDSAPGAKIVLFGFSLGAMIALLVATALWPAHIYTCSLSAFFREDLARSNRTTIRTLGIRRWRELQTLSLASLAKTIDTPTDIFVGQKELPAMIACSKRAHHLLTRASLYLVPDTGHSLGSHHYQEAIKQVFH